MRPYSGNGCLVAVRFHGSLFCLTQFRHSSGSTKKRIKFTPPPVSTRRVSVRITLFVGQFDIRSLLFGSAVRNDVVYLLTEPEWFS